MTPHQENPESTKQASTKVATGRGNVDGPNAESTLNWNNARHLFSLVMLVVAGTPGPSDPLTNAQNLLVVRDSSAQTLHAPSFNLQRIIISFSPCNSRCSRLQKISSLNVGSWIEYIPYYGAFNSDAHFYT
ncbi:predicted protein [Histoplasma mississippiense (nom. inval.)]|uniref:predicted protein n=1 Tax=Ajellomyces capsulatus (strain NAm1 / WU24) TaxID=2059318 RepID=UPI000157C5DE|nr:predicted protein [Histoplasma mississippiense (nom. inval.)]EDN08076.1 predicted protein [Histoplasma mississippiense (nom. inval.)]